MTIDELIPSILSLTHAEKIRLLQVVLQQLAGDEAVSVPPPSKQPTEHFDPRRFYGIAQQSRQDVDEYLASTREGWN